MSKKARVSIDMESEFGDRLMVITVDGEEVFRTDYDSVGWSGMSAIEDAVSSVLDALDIPVSQP